ncbi:MAG: DUF99 family protein [Candidatus Micrarchaeia archaeon]
MNIEVRARDLLLLWAYQMKKGIRVLSIACAPFEKSDKTALVIGVVSRGQLIEGLLSLRVSVDGNDATRVLAKKVKSSRFKDQIRLIALNGVALAGLNILDIEELSSSLKIPIMILTRKKPRLRAMSLAIKAATKNKDVATRKLVMLNKIKKVSRICKINGFYTQSIGIEKGEINLIIGEAIAMLRVAHIIASGISNGESKGRI